MLMQDYAIKHHQTLLMCALRTNQGILPTLQFCCYRCRPVRKVLYECFENDKTKIPLYVQLYTKASAHATICDYVKQTISNTSSSFASGNSFLGTFALQVTVVCSHLGD